MLLYQFEEATFDDSEITNNSNNVNYKNRQFIKYLFYKIN